MTRIPHGLPMAARSLSCERSGDRVMLYLISPLGGGERKLAEVGSWVAELVARWKEHRICGQEIAERSVEYLVAIGGNAGKEADDHSGCKLLRRRVDRPSHPTVATLHSSGDFEAARSALYVMPLPRGEPRLVTDYNSPLAPCWTADSREIVFTTPCHRENGVVADLRGRRRASQSPDAWRVSFSAPRSAGIVWPT